MEHRCPTCRAAFDENNIPIVEKEGWFCSAEHYETFLRNPNKPQMSNFNFKDSIEKAETKYDVGGGGDWFKFQKGVNKIRVLASSSEPIANHFIGENGSSKNVVCIGKNEGCPFHGKDAPVGKDGKPKKPSIKYLMYIIDRKNDAIRLVSVAYSVVKQIGELQMTEDWEFDSLPMPYDLTVKYDPDAAPNDKYKVIASPKRELVNQETLNQLAELKPLDEILEKIKAKQAGNMPEIKEGKSEDLPVINQDEEEPPIDDVEEPQIDLKDIPF